MPKIVPLNWLLFFAMLGSLVVAACGGGGKPEEITFDLRIANGGLANLDSTLEVKHNDIVRFNVTSDEAASFHLHGYDHELQLAPNVTSSFTFTADATGSFPITIHVGAETGSASSMTMNGSSDHHHKTIEAPADLYVGVEAAHDPASGVNLMISTSGFTFAPYNASLDHVPGEGHAHVYVDGVKINRVYGPHYHLPDLSPGERSIRITLNANSHEQYALNGQLVEATTIILIPGEVMAEAGHHSAGSMSGESGHHSGDTTAGESIEVELGRFVVLPR